VKIRLIAATLSALALTAATPVAAGAQVRPQVTMCNWTLAMWMGQNSAGVPTVNVSGSVELSCGGPWTAPYLVIEREMPGGYLQYAASGMGYASYTCQGSTPNDYKMDGEIPTGVVYTTGVVNCG
jgi:hypothetical protein